MKFLAPWWLLALLAVVSIAGLYLFLMLRRRSYAVRFTNLQLLDTVAPRTPGWRRHVAAALTFLGLASVSIAMAQPAVDAREDLERATIVLAIDVSLSMQAEDVDPNRFDAAKNAAKVFVDSVPEKYNLSLVAFARNARVVVSPTKQHTQVSSAIDQLELQASTAIGEAIFSSLDAIASVPSAGTDSEAPAQIVLLSDGFTTSGRSNESGAVAAKEAGVPVSTIAFGTPDGYVIVDDYPVPVPVDEKALRDIAETTKGKHRTATSAEELTDVYRDLGSSVGYRTVDKEITRWFVGAGLILAIVGGALSLFWTSRLV